MDMSPAVREDAEERGSGGSGLSHSDDFEE
jgi:hypothetical protein